jgi:hypothetical protein
MVHIWNTSSAWPRTIAMEYRKGNVSWNELDAWVKEGQWTWDEFANRTAVLDRIPHLELEDIALVFEEYEPFGVDWAGDFFVTGRRLSCCMTPAGGSELGGPDIERSQLSHISEYKEPASIVFEKKLRSISVPATNGNIALKLNSVIETVNQELWSSLRSPERKPYGKVSFLETDFVRKQMSQLVRLLGKAGIQDQPLEEIPGMRDWISGGLGKVSNAKTALALGSLSTRELARDLDISEGQARRIHSDLLIRALMALNPTSLPVEIKPENPIIERFNFEFSEQKLRELDRSARSPVAVEKS